MHSYINEFSQIINRQATNKTPLSTISAVQKIIDHVVHNDYKDFRKDMNKASGTEKTDSLLKVILELHKCNLEECNAIQAFACSNGEHHMLSKLTTQQGLTNPQPKLDLCSG